MNMSENRQEKCKSVTLEGLCDDNCSISKDGLNSLAYKHFRVEEGEAFVPASEYKVEVEHLLTEKEYGSIVEDDFFFMNSADTEKYLALEDFPSPENFGSINTDFGISNIEVTRSPGELGGSMLQNHEDQCCHVMEHLYSDFISESGFAGKSSHLDDGLHGRHCLRNLCSDYSQILEVDSDVDETLNLTKTVNLKTDGKSDPNALYLDNMSIDEIHDAFRSTYGQSASIADKQWLKQCILCGLCSGIDVDNPSNNVKSRILLDDNKDMVLLATTNPSEALCASPTSSPDQKVSVGGPVNEKHTDKDPMTASVLDTGRFGLVELESRDCTSVTRKRMRKPTRRYIEESSEEKSRLCAESLGSLIASPQERILHVGTHNVHWKRSGSTQMICSERSSTLSYFVRPRRGRPRKNIDQSMGSHALAYLQNVEERKNERQSLKVKTFKGKKGHVQNAVDHGTVCGSVMSRSENEDDTSESTRSDNYGVRRKHHRLWTLTEVTKLVEGVSQYGVGRWTEIKRLLFSSSAYRTSVDLKDKWRNLLKASGAHPCGQKEIETRKKHLTGLVPQAVLRRVRDLAVMYPYPRERKTRTPLLLAPAPAAPANGKDATTPCNKRTGHKRSPCSSA